MVLYYRVIGEPSVSWFWVALNQGYILNAFSTWTALSVIHPCFSDSRVFNYPSGSLL